MYDCDQTRMTKLRKYNTKSQKLNTEQVRQLYNDLMDGMTQSAAARKWDLSVIQVGRIARGESRANETGARQAPIPNFNRQFTEEEIAAGERALIDRLAQAAAEPPRVDAVAEFRAAAAAKRKAPSLYNDPPPSVPGEAEGSGLDRLQREIAQADPLAGLMDDSDKPTGD